MFRILIILFFIFCSQQDFAQTVDFSFLGRNSGGCAIQFTPNCTGFPIGYKWDFSGDISFEDEPVKIYAHSGTYNVKLTAVYEDREVSVSKDISVTAASVDSIHYDRNYICEPGPITFKAVRGESVTEYKWNFGDNTSILSTSSPTVSHNFTKQGADIVTLIAIGTNGCNDTVTTAISLQPPVITGTFSTDTKCIPADVRFRAEVTIPDKSKVSSYQWNFGDGSLIQDTISRKITKTFALPGRFTPQVTVTTSEGCKSTFSFGEMAFGTRPTNLVAYTKNAEICVSKAVELVAHAANATMYEWIYGDGHSRSTSDTLVTHSFDTDGVKDSIFVTPTFNGCAGDTTKLQVTVIGTGSSFDYANTCADKRTYSFTNTSKGNISSVLWQFLGLGPDVTTINAIKTFPDTGSYRVRLTITDDITGCVSKSSKTIYTAEPILKNDDTAVCKKNITTFSIQNNYADTSSSYTWHVVGKTIDTNTNYIELIADTLVNDFHNYVIIKYGGPGSCPDTIPLTHKLSVSKPSLDFSAPETICFEDPLEIINHSEPLNPGGVITSWRWNFGNSFDSSKDFQPAPYYSKKKGNFYITLIAMDKNGCSDTLSKPYSVKRKPFVHIPAGVGTLCPEQEATLIALHSDTVYWSPSNTVSCNNCDTIIIKPTENTTYIAAVSTDYGCIATDSVQVKVRAPFIASAPVSDFYICEKDSVRLAVYPPDYNISWLPTTSLSDPTLADPIASPRENTTYVATLKDSAGCKDDVSITVHVNKLPVVDAGPDASYSLHSNFSLFPVYSSNVISYTWAPATWLDCNDCAFPKGILDRDVQYMVSVTSDSGCVATDSVFISIKDSVPNLLTDCEKRLFMPGAFTPNNDKLNDYYFPLAKGIRIITRFSIYNRFGQQVFEARNFFPNDPTHGWNGKLHGKDLPVSTYVYLLEAVCEEGETLKQKGNFALLR